MIKVTLWEGCRKAILAVPKPAITTMVSIPQGTTFKGRLGKIFGLWIKTNATAATLLYDLEDESEDDPPAIGEHVVIGVVKDYKPVKIEMVVTE